MNTKEKIFVPLTDDLLFKETFGNVENISFLEYLLEIYYDYSLGLLKNKLEVYYEQIIDKTKYQDKCFRSDLKVVINNEILCNIEMFSHFNEDAFQKSKPYILRIYSTQLNIGDNYSKIKKVTQINFVDNVNKDIKVMIDEEIKRTLYLGNELASKDLNLDIVKLDLARKIEYNENDKFMKLLKFLSANTLEEREKFAKGTPIEEISEITELSLEEIKNLQNEN